jgi:hypothetical protein
MIVSGQSRAAEKSLQPHLAFLCCRQPFFDERIEAAGEITIQIPAFGFDVELCSFGF